LTIKGANIDTRFRTSLPCCLAFRDSVRFALIATDAGIDIDAAISRLNLRRGASDDGEGEQGEKHYSLHVQSSFPRVMRGWRDDGSFAFPASGRSNMPDKLNR
jgi:hypothetical protein